MRQNWPAYAHALLGAVTYIVALKLILTEAGSYGLTDGDKADAAALPGRVECLRLSAIEANGQEGTARSWHDARLTARFSAAWKAAEMLVKELGGTD